MIKDKRKLTTSKYLITKIEEEFIVGYLGQNSEKGSSREQWPGRIIQKPLRFSGRAFDYKFIAGLFWE
jgi:hypothetical protein